MNITIHRGTKQIGGCATEITSGNTRIVIDLGSELPGKDGTKSEERLFIGGVTKGAPRCDGVFFTHIHGDHIGQIDRILPGIPIYMGEVGRDVCLTLNKSLASIPDLDVSRTLAALEGARTFEPAYPTVVGDIKITPFFVDHSAIDSYMFLIEADGLKVLHTGDFRSHGFLGKGLIPTMEKYVGQVDWLICEGTMLSRSTEDVMTEMEVKEQAQRIMGEHKNVFVLCSSTNIDRIGAFHHAKPGNRPTVSDIYQKDVLNIIQKHKGHKSDFFNFEKVYSYSENNKKLIEWMAEEGFLWFIRATDSFRPFLERYRGNSKIIYSMWSGYLSGETKNQKYIDFLDGFEYEILHTSGHATTKALKEVCEAVNPRQGIIPIHSENPEGFADLLPNRNVLLLTDGEELTL